MLDQETVKHLGTLSAVGAVVGLGKLIVSTEPITIRAAVGRSIVSGGIGLAAASAVIIVPGLSIAAQIGLGALLASLGTSALERLLQRFTGTS
jgi:hypothetical protein